MSTLHDLRLNCLLAALVPVALGVAALIVYAVLAEGHHRHRRHQDLRQMAALMVAGATDLAGVSIERLVADHVDVVSAAVLTTEEVHGVRLLRHVGEGLSIDPESPPPLLIEAWTMPRSWRLDGHRMALATAVRDDHQAAVGLLYLEVRLLPQWNPWLTATWIGSLLLAAGGLLAVYLTRRIYRPVVTWQRQAEAALTGGPPLPVVTTAETAALATAIDQLASAYRSSTGGEDAPR